MGNAESEVKGEKYVKAFQNKLKYEVRQIKEYSDVYDQEVTLYHDRETKRVIAQIRKQNEQEHFDLTQERLLDERITSTKTHNLLKLYGYSSSLQQDSICGNSYFRYFFVDHPVGTLKDEIELRKHMENPRPYTEVELWGFLYSIVQALVALKEKDKKCKNISSSTIYIDLDGYYQICELGIIKETAIFDEIVFKQFGKDMYLSPGQMLVIREQTLHDDTCPYLSDIYALGVLVTELAYLEEQGDLYRYYGDTDKIDIDYDKLKIRIQYLETKYKNKKLIRLLQNMTEKEEKKRITLEELNNELERNYLRLLQDRTETDINDCPSHKTSFIETIINRSQYESLYKKKKRSEYDSAEVKPVFKNKKRLTSRLGYEERHGEDGEEGVKILSSNHNSMSHIRDDQNSEQNSLKNIKGDDISSVNDGSHIVIKANDSKGKSQFEKVMPAIQLSQYMMRKNMEKQNLIKKQAELQQLQNKSHEQEQEIEQIKQQISDIDKSITIEKKGIPEVSRLNTPNRQVHFSAIEEELATPTPRLSNQSKQIRVLSIAPDQNQLNQEQQEEAGVEQNRGQSETPKLVGNQLYQSEYTNYEGETHYANHHVQNNNTVQLQNRNSLPQQNRSRSSSPTNNQINQAYNKFDETVPPQQMIQLSNRKQSQFLKEQAYNQPIIDNQQNQYYPNTEIPQMLPIYQQINSQQYPNQNIQYANQNIQYGNQTIQYGNQNIQYGNQNIQYGNQNAQFGELFNQNQSSSNQRQSPLSHKYNLNRYEQRLSKNNVCTDRYNKLTDLFFDDDTILQQNVNKKELPKNMLLDSGKKFKNKLIKKQSIQQIIVNNSIKKNGGNRNASPLAKTVNPFEKGTKHQYSDNINTIHPHRLQKNLNSHSVKDLGISARDLKQAIPDQGFQNFSLNTNRSKIVRRSQEMPFQS